MKGLAKRALHLRVNGQSAELALADLDLQADATDAQIKNAVERHMGLPALALASYVIVRTSQAIIVRPEAIYG